MAFYRKGHKIFPHVVLVLVISSPVQQHLHALCEAMSRGVQKGCVADLVSMVDTRPLLQKVADDFRVAFFGCMV